MRLIRELIGDVRTRYPRDSFFSDFQQSCQISELKLRYYKTYDNAFRALDDCSWKVLKSKALDHFMDHRKGQLKQGFFNQLNEAFAYRHLLRQGYLSVRILRETGQKTPDIEFRERRLIRYCEVKTIGISDQEIERRESIQSFGGDIYMRLNPGFFNKFKCVLDQASQQLSIKGSHGLIFVVMLNDDIALDYYSDYRRQIQAYCYQKGVHDLYIKVGLRGSKRIPITSQSSRRGDGLASRF